ncbi:MULTISPECIES: replication endonuclease [unclassified Pseudoalteromonas]|uniref:replication endonuclease n=1 Tax=unclassified Pseudoalteromonas TaxID=194690 RepID=UPI000694792B|nr:MULTISPECIES: replication endonuclease [unclassified Pseudoalteromonas]
MNNLAYKSEQSRIEEFIFPVAVANDITAHIEEPKTAKDIYKNTVDFSRKMFNAKTFREEIYSKHTSLAVMLANGYKQLERFYGFDEANKRIQQADKVLTLWDIDLSIDDNDLCDIADIKARNCLLKINDKGQTFEVYNELKEYLKLYTFDAPEFDQRYFLHSVEKQAELDELNDSIGRQAHIDLIAALGRISDPLWWRRQLRKKQALTVEQLARDLRLVHKKASPYISDFTVQTRRIRKQKNQKILSDLFLLADGQSPFSDDLETLQSVCEKSHTSGYQQASELMVRIRGTEDVAKMHGHIGEFYTLTCPSRFHATSSKGIPNKKYQNLTPNDAQNYFNNIWKLARARFSKANLKPYGFRVVEPHHDGCPHWHMLLFMQKGEAKQIRKILKELCMRDTPEEVGTYTTRFKPIYMNPKKGSAAGYIAKYITKAVTGSNLKTIEDSISGKVNIAPADAAERARSWAATFNIRQFEAIGLPSVTVWREMRRLGMGTTGQCEIANSMNTTVDKIANFALEKVRLAADASDWAAFCLAMGGVQIKRKDQAVRIHYQIPDLVDTITGEISRTEGASPLFATKYGDTPSNRVLGIAWDQITVITRRGNTEVLSQKELKARQKMMTGAREFFEEWEDNDWYMRPSESDMQFLEAMAIEDKMNHCLFLDYEALGSNFTSDEITSLDLCH